MGTRVESVGSKRLKGGTSLSLLTICYSDTYRIYADKLCYCGYTCLRTKGTIIPFVDKALIGPTVFTAIDVFRHLVSVCNQKKNLLREYGKLDIS